jgi:hypothetical protein
MDPAPPARSGKKYLLLVVVLLALVAGGALWVLGKLRGAKVDDVAARLPANTSAVLIATPSAESLSELAKALDDPAFDPALKQKLATLGARHLGFDVASASAWLATGVDPLRAWAVAALNRGTPRDWDVLVLVPSHDDAALERTLLGLCEKNGVSVSDDARPGFTAHLAPGGAAFTVADGFAVLALSSRSAVDVLATFFTRPERSLAQDEGFRAALRASGTGSQLLAYAAPAAVDMLQQGAGAEQPWLADLADRGASLSARLEGHKASSRVSLLNRPGSLLARIAGHDLVEPLDAHVRGEPLALLRLQLDLARLMELVVPEAGASGPAADLFGAALEQRFGIDLKQDVLGLLDGRITLLLLPAAPGEALPSDYVVYAGLRDMARGQAAFERVVSKLGLPAERIQHSATGTWFMAPEAASVGVTRSHLVLFVGGPARQIADLEQGGQSFVDKLPASARAQLARNDAGFLFVDSARSASLLDRAALPGAVDPIQAQVARAVQSFSATLHIEGDTWTLDTLSEAPEQGFSSVWRALLERVLRDLDSAPK